MPVPLHMPGMRYILATAVARKRQMGCRICTRTYGRKTARLLSCAHGKKPPREFFGSSRRSSGEGPRHGAHLRVVEHPACESEFQRHLRADDLGVGNTAGLCTP